MCTNESEAIESDNSIIDNDSNLISKLTCCICCDFYKQPVTVECLHTFCLICYKSLFKNQNDTKIECPVCKGIIIRGSYFENKEYEVLIEVVKKIQDTISHSKQIECKEKIENWLDNCLIETDTDTENIDDVEMGQANDKINDKEEKNETKELTDSEKIVKKKRKSKRVQNQYNTLNCTITKKKPRKRKVKFESVKDETKIEEFDTQVNLETDNTPKIVERNVNVSKVRIEKKSKEKNTLTEIVEKNVKESEEKKPKTEWKRMKNLNKKIKRKQIKYNKLDVSLDLNKSSKSDHDQNPKNELNSSNNLIETEIQLKENEIVVQNNVIDNENEKENNNPIEIADVFSIPTQKLQYDYRNENESENMNINENVINSSESEINTVQNEIIADVIVHRIQETNSESIEEENEILNKIIEGPIKIIEGPIQEEITEPKQTPVEELKQSKIDVSVQTDDLNCPKCLSTFKFYNDDKIPCILSSTSSEIQPVKKVNRQLTYETEINKFKRIRTLSPDSDSGSGSGFDPNSNAAKKSKTINKPERKTETQEIDSFLEREYQQYRPVANELILENSNLDHFDQLLADIEIPERNENVPKENDVEMIAPSGLGTNGQNDDVEMISVPVPTTNKVDEDVELDREVELLTSSIVEDSLGSDEDLFEDDVVVETTPKKEISFKRKSKVKETNPKPQTPNLNLNPIVLAQQSKYSPLQVIVTAKQNQTPKRTTTPKVQKTILNYMTPPQQKSQIPSSRRTPLRNPQICISYTRLLSQQINAVLNLTEQLKLKYSKNFDASVTHMVVAVDDQNRIIDHTMKYVLAIAHGIWIVSFAWVKDSLTRGQLLPEEQYEILDVSGIPGPKRSRIHRKTNPLFKNFIIYCAQSLIYVTKEDLEDAITTLGGQIKFSLNDLEQIKSKTKDKYFLILTECKDTLESEPYQTWRENYNTLVVELEWLSRTVGQYQIISVRPFLMCSEDGIEQLGYPYELIAHVPDSEM